MDDKVKLTEMPKELEQYLVEKAKIYFGTNIQPERLSEKTSVDKIIYRRSDSLNSMET